MTDEGAATTTTTLLGSNGLYHFFLWGVSQAVLTFASAARGVLFFLCCGWLDRVLGRTGAVPTDHEAGLVCTALAFMWVCC